MATFVQTHSPILSAPAQLLLLPVNSAGVILDPIISRCKTLYPDNYQSYRRLCLQGKLNPGQCLLVTLNKQQTGLSAASTGNRVAYVANLLVSDHPYHPVRQQWLSDALEDLHPQLWQLVRYHGLRRMALWADPLIAPLAKYGDSSSQQPQATSQPQLIDQNSHQDPPSQVPVLDWQQQVYPLLQQHLADIPKLQIDIHLPKQR